MPAAPYHPYARHYEILAAHTAAARTSLLVARAHIVQSLQLIRESRTELERWDALEVPFLYDEPKRAVTALGQ
jgi:hypothetical protein